MARYQDVYLVQDARHSSARTSPTSSNLGPARTRRMLGVRDQSSPLMNEFADPLTFGGALGSKHFDKAFHASRPHESLVNLWTPGVDQLPK